jgi:Lipase (class 3)
LESDISFHYFPSQWPLSTSLTIAPRIGNTVFAAFVNRKIPSYYRVEVDSDIVTMVPMVIGMYRHAGTPVVIDSDESGELNMGEIAYLSCYIKQL